MASITPLQGRPFTPSHIDRPRVLVIEDDALVAIVIRNLLDQIGCAVVGPFTEADAALAAASFGSLSAAIVDHVRVGERDYAVEDALAVCGVPFGFVLGRPAAEIEPRYRGRPHVVKPFTTEQLYGLVAKLLEKSQPSD